MPMAFRELGYHRPCSAGELKARIPQYPWYHQLTHEIAWFIFKLNFFLLALVGTLKPA